MASASDAKEPTPIVVCSGDSDPLDWRVDPSTSRSDWTIRIRSDRSQQDDTGTCTASSHPPLEQEYHVHINNITMGPRASNYFKAVCFAEFAEHVDRVSYIDLHPTAAKYIPVLLDYLYRGELRVNSYNVLALQYSARYFDCVLMLHSVNAYCLAYLKPHRCARLYKQAMELELFDVIEALQTYCADNILKFNDHSSIVDIDSMDFWLSVVRQTVPSIVKDQRLSALLVKICKKQRNTMDLATFEQLTSGLTSVSRRVATTLLELELYFQEAEASTMCTKKRKRSDELTSLQWTCMGVLVDEFGKPGSEVFMKLPRGLPEEFHREFIKRAHAEVAVRSFSNTRMPY